MKERKKKKKNRTRWWLSNGDGSTSRRRDTSSGMTGLPVTVALVLRLSSLSGAQTQAFSSFHRFHILNIQFAHF